ncbi:hypothetical protein [Leifsonia sp. 2MCAF36]|uniref:hypothetical protein n=1 Tax=Leifsonia sp. 2MCAF36 TaxID=3232988 RepID=UPI003F9C5614
MRIAPTDDLPRVPISAFKTNPVRYLETGALVTNHGKVRAAFVPVDDTDDGLDGIKAQLGLLARMTAPEDVASELAELAASRDSELVGDAR